MDNSSTSIKISGFDKHRHCLSVNFFLYLYMFDRFGDFSRSSYGKVFPKAKKMHHLRETRSHSSNAILYFINNKFTPFAFHSYWVSGVAYPMSRQSFPEEDVSIHDNAFDE